MSGTAESGETAGMQAGGGLGHLPWQQIPRFIPGTTNVDEYAKRLEFLKELWPVEHLALLGPRAALQVEGAAFQKVSRIAPDKLKGNDGVKLLVESLGGSWGRSSVEDKYYYFEQAIFQTCQKHDESNDSYIARHDAHFEELIAKGVKLEEIRAYLLLRHSQLSAEDKKRVVIEAKGKLDYDSTVKAVKLLGSKFFGELQNRGSSSGGRQTERNKVYEINFADDDQEEAEVHYAADSDDDSLVALLAEQGDEDAVYVTEFEEQIIEAVQDSSLAPVFSAYQEARQRLRDKAKARGFWPKGRGKSSKGKTGRKGSGKGGARHRTLADRIANSTCRICGLAGHWKRECPQREGNSRTEVTNFTQMAMNDNNLPEILHTLPDDACDFEMNEGQARTWSKPGHKVGIIECPSLLMAVVQATPKVSIGSRLKEALACRLLMFDRTARHKKGRNATAAATSPEDSSRSHFGRTCEETALVLTEGSEGVLDTGASRTVVGAERVSQVLHGLPEGCRKNVKRTQSAITFRFGNSGTLSSKYALLVPSSSGRWIRLEVIPGNTPLLISNKLLRELDAVIHVRQGFLQIGEAKVPTRLDGRGLSLVDFAVLLSCDASHSCLMTHNSDERPATAPITPQSTAAHTLKCSSSQPSPASPIVPPSSSLCEPRADHAEAEAPEEQRCRTQGGPRISRSGSAFVGSGGSRTGNGADHSRPIQECGVQQATWGHDSPTVGRDHADGREIQGPFACTCVPIGHSLQCAHGQEVNAQQCLGTELQELCHSEIEVSGQSGAPAQHQEGMDPQRGGRGDRWMGDLPINSGEHQARQTTHTGHGLDQTTESPDVGSNELHDGSRTHRRAADGDRHTPSAPSPGTQNSGAVAAASGRDRVRCGGMSASVSEGSTDTGIQGDIEKLCRKIDSRISAIEAQLMEGAGQVVHDMASQYRLPALDVIEVAPSAGNMVSYSIQKCGGRALCLKHRQLHNSKGQFGRLWQAIHMYRPLHIWIDARQPWMTQGHQCTKKWWPWDLFLELYQHQLERGHHFHLCCGPHFFEQAPPDFIEVQQGMLMAIHHLPELEPRVQILRGNNFYQRRTCIYTTSRTVHRAIDTRIQTHTLKQQPSSGLHDTAPRRQMQQLSLGSCAASAMLGCKEVPLYMAELLLGEGTREHPQEDLAAAQQVVKRRRIWGKQALPETMHVGNSQSEPLTWERVFQEVNSRVPRGGGVGMEEGDEITTMVQQLMPNMHVCQVVFCRGTNRVQMPKGTWSHRDIPLRQVVVVRRDNGQVELDGSVEEWTKVPRYKQCRKGVPARISATVFGASFRDPYAQPDRSRRAQDFANPHVQHDASHRAQDEEGMLRRAHSETEHRDERDEVSQRLMQGFPPKAIPKHGPGYLELSEQDRGTLGRLHNHLGHPSPEVFAKFLAERKAEPHMIRAARDYSCSVCQETTSLPKLSRPSAIHSDGDFGDVIGMDVAYWTNSAGKTFMFTHVLDEATLFEQAEATGRTQQEQFEVLADHWFQWAGPCKTLYVDPAGEYTGDHWRNRLQQEGIQAHVSAGEAHWQLGRVEAHGRILKSMLTRMDSQEPIASDAEFRRCIRQAVHAKNSLSRVKGFTPEQAVLGKMARLPASLVADEQASSHALAESNSPEGVAFRRDLLRREHARVAFMQADNDSSYRRALLRRSRPICQSFEAGDWVLYWRRSKNGSRGERGRWYGPSQVVCSEPKVVWLSHCGRLVRAAPEQLRSASMREWQAVSLQQHRGEGQSALGQDVRGVVDLTNQGLPSRGEIDDEGDVPSSVVPPATLNEAPLEPPAEDTEMIEPPPVPSLAEQPEVEVSPVPSVNTPEAASVPVPDDDDDDLLFGDTVCFFAHPAQGQAWEILLHETEVPCHSLPSAEQALQYVLLASTERKKRVEVRLKDLNHEEAELFHKAKAKEIGAWLDHKTVRRVTGGTLDDSQLLRCRWILTWKPPDKEGMPRRAKARLVVLGFEDPDIQSIPNDAPTLGKDARQMILQKVVSNRWKLINFDVSTAFLQGKGDGRTLGIHPPEELRQALRMKPSDQCLLEGGAYGRIDAPFLWFQTFKETLEELGFIQSPFDACTFSLVTPGPNDKPVVHGVLGIHVDDGIGGGDEYFSEVLEQLRGIYSFGSYDEGEFTFTGVRFRQWDDGSVEMDQTQYLEKIKPIHVPKSRRAEPHAALSRDEVHELRRLNGSLQYAAVHTRPDVAARVGMLQSAVSHGEVRHLLEANKVLYEAKANPVSIMIVPIPEKHVTFCSFSDASFATTKDNNSYQGTLVFATDWRMLANERAVVVPVAWSSKKISRVVRSTLSAEVVSLCGTVDRMSWLRLLWEWMKSPDIDLSSPDEVLKRAPKAALVTDCKSAFDIATKTAVPACTELRTQLECLLLRERLQENCQMRWVHSKAMLADCLTKSMDSSELRKCLERGSYALFDEVTVLENRAGKRQSLKWLSANTQEHK